jgi:N-glycosylase/DNA lyase
VVERHPLVGAPLRDPRLLGTAVDANPEWVDYSREVASAWSVCADIFCRAVSSPVTRDVRVVQAELVFCLLSGFSVSYELACSAANCVTQLDPFNPRWTDDRLHETLLSELCKPQFEPRGAGGQLRRYRFPQMKAGLLLRARGWVTAQGNVLETLLAQASDQERRQLLCECPGLGPKSATLLLRNIGLANHLAIVDVHIRRALVAAGRVDVRSAMCYEAAERAFLTWCDDLHAAAPAFDLFLWEWQRGMLEPVNQNISHAR